MVSINVDVTLLNKENAKIMLFTILRDINSTISRNVQEKHARSLSMEPGSHPLKIISFLSRPGSILLTCLLPDLSVMCILLHNVLLLRLCL